jgi:hypothetical protein
MFRHSHVHERLELAIIELATARHKLRERVIDVYYDNLSTLVVREFPNEETRQIFTTIREMIKKEENKVERRPGPYELLLRERLKTPLQILRDTPDYRTAGKLARLIVHLYFAIEAGIKEEYEKELQSYRETERHLKQLNQR